VCLIIVSKSDFIHKFRLLLDCRDTFKKGMIDCLFSRYSGVGDPLEALHYQVGYLNKIFFVIAFLVEGEKLDHVYLLRIFNFLKQLDYLSLTNFLKFEFVQWGWKS
jgi:hypothetical protein